MTTHQQKKLERRRPDRLPQPLQAAADRRAGRRRSPSTSRPTTAPRCATCTRAARALGGYHAAPRSRAAPALPVPALAQLRRASRCNADGKEMSTTMAFVRMLGGLLKDAALGPRVVPIVADEARTFGMANLFKQVGIYSQRGPALRARGHRLGAVATARRLDGQILEEGISEAGAHRAAGRPRPPATACTAWRCCRSTSTTRCSASSASAT